MIKSRTFLAIGLLFILTSCTSPPLLELQEAREAIALARDFEADVYASDQYDLALMNLEIAEIEIEEQEQVSAFGRNYSQALAMLDGAIVEAEEARFLAEEYKASIFEQTESTLLEAQMAVDDAFESLAQARPYLTFQEAQSLSVDLSTAATSLNLARQLMDEGGIAAAAARMDEIIVTVRAIEARARFIIDTAPQ